MQKNGLAQWFSSRKFRVVLIFWCLKRARWKKFPPFSFRVVPKWCVFRWLGHGHSALKGRVLTFFLNGVNHVIHLINSDGRSTVLMILWIFVFLGPPGPKKSPKMTQNVHWGLLQSLRVQAFVMLGHRINFYFHLSKKSKFNFGTEKISLDEQ